MISETKARIRNEMVSHIHEAVSFQASPVAINLWVPDSVREEVRLFVIETTSQSGSRYGGMHGAIIILNTMSPIDIVSI